MDAIKCILFLFLCCRLLPRGDGRNVTSRPGVVNIGALLTYDSYIGRVAKIAIEQAVNDVNANSSILPGTKLVLAMHDSKCSGFIGMVEALRFMEKDVMAIIGPQSSVVSHIISHVANELQVPLVSFAATDPTLSSLQFPFFVRTSHSDLYQMSAVADIVEHYSWKQVIAIYIDNDFGRNGVAALGDKLSDKRFKIAEKFGIPESGVVTRANIMDYLVKVALLEARVIVLHVYPQLGFDIFSVAKYLGMMGNGYVWIATDWLSTVCDSASPLPGETMETMQGVLALRQHVPESAKKKAFTSRWNKLTGGSPGLDHYGLHAYDSVWLVAQAIDSFFNQGGNVSFSDDTRLRSLEDGTLNLKGLSIFDGGRLLLRSILQGNLVGLTGLLKFDSDGSLMFPSYDVMNIIGTGFRQIGYWSNYSGLTTALPETLYSGPANRSAASQQLLPVIWPGDTLTTPRGWVFPNNGKQLKIGVPDRVSFREFVSRIPGTNSFKGFCIDVFTAAVNLLPYAVPYQFVPEGDGKSNPSYTELVNKITTGDLDAVVGDIAIVTNRTKIVDFTQPYAASGLVVVAPFKRSNTGAWAFLSPFSMPMWIVTSCCFLGIGIVVWILEHRINDEFRGPPKRQIITVLWFSLSTLFFAHRENTLSTLGRFVLIIWLFVVLIINSSYTASLTSILTVQQLSSPIKGIETLKESNEPIGYQVGSFAEYYLSQELGIPADRLVPLGSPEAFVAALQKGPKNGGVAALVDERPYVELFLSSQCTFRIVGEEFTKGGWGFVFPRDSPLAVDLSTAILQLSESGDLQRIHDKWLSRSSCSADTSQIDSNRLHLQSFWGLFLLCGVVCFLALFIYFWQMVHQLYRNNREASTSSAGRVSFRSGRHLQRLISLMDEKHDPSKNESKKRKLERSLSENDRDAEAGRNVKGK